MFFKKKKDKEKTSMSETIVTGIWSPVSSGASTLSVILSNYCLNKTDKYITLMDADIYASKQDLLLKTKVTPPKIPNQEGKGSFNLISDALVKEILTNDVYKELTIPYHERFDLITGNTSPAEGETIWNGDKNSTYFKDMDGLDSFAYYNEILKNAKHVSNMVFIDTSTNVYMDSTKFYLAYSDKVIVVVSANYSQIYPAALWLEHSKNNFRLTPEKTCVVINKYSKGSIGVNEVKKILKGWNVLDTVIYSDADMFDKAVNSGNYSQAINKNEKLMRELLEFIDN